jgi:hypothetical protein
VPIFAGAVVPAPPPTPSPTPARPHRLLRSPRSGTPRSSSYIDPHGVVWPMTDASAPYYALADGVSGLGAAPVTLTTDPLPRGGVRLRHVQPQARTIIWPVHVEGDTHQEFIDLWRAMGRAFTDTLRYGPGILDIARPDGRRRQIKVRYQDGWDGLGQAGTGLLGQGRRHPARRGPVLLRPGAGRHRPDLRLSPAPRTSCPRTRQVSNSQVLGDTTLTNPGDVIAVADVDDHRPGEPGDDHQLRHRRGVRSRPERCGHRHGNLLAGEYVTVITDPPAVRFGNGDVWTGIPELAVRSPVGPGARRHRRQLRPRRGRRRKRRSALSTPDTRWPDMAITLLATDKNLNVLGDPLSGWTDLAAT